MNYCEFCGCIDTDPCVDLSGLPCHWVAPFLCSACAPFVVIGFRAPLHHELIPSYLEAI